MHNAAKAIACCPERQPAIYGRTRNTQESARSTVSPTCVCVCVCVCEYSVCEEASLREDTKRGCFAPSQPVPPAACAQVDRRAFHWLVTLAMRDVISSIGQTSAHTPQKSAAYCTVL